MEWNFLLANSIGILPLGKKKYFDVDHVPYDSEHTYCVKNMSYSDMHSSPPS